jgi:GAF domain-containing protein/HAMP domain-containing protein
MERNQKSEIEKSKLTIPTWRQLRWNLILFSVLLAVMPVAIAIAVTLYLGSEQATEQVKSQLTSIAELKRGQINRWLEASEGVLTLFLADANRRDQLINFVAFASPQEGGVIQSNLNNILNEAVQAQPLFEQFFVYNTAGEILAASNPDEIGKLVTRQPYFAHSLKSKYIQPPYYALGTADLAMLITQPLIDQRGQTVGVLAGRLNLNTLGQIMTDRVGLGLSGETYLVSLESHYLVTPSRFEDQGYVPTQAYYSNGIDRVLNGEEGSGTYGDYRNPPITVIGAYRWLPELQVGLLAEIDEAEALATYTRAQNLSIGIAIVAALAAIGVGFYSATRISKPITALTQVASQITAGDLNQRAEIRQRNEIGLLAMAFNSMTAQLREFIGSLEERIAARTERLEIVATLSERLSAILKVEELLKEVVIQIRDRFGYYHAHIYLLDEKRENLVVTAGTGEAGAQMKARGHSIDLDAPTSLVARAARTGEIVRVDNVREAVDWLPNPLLPDTYSEMAVPIILEGQVVGVLDVQQDRIAGLDETDASLLRTVANQVAVAIRNARLFTEVETALKEARALQQRYIEQTWDKTRVTQKSVGRVQFSLGESTTLSEAIVMGAQQQALRYKKPTVVALKRQQVDDANHHALVAPIVHRDVVIGDVQLHEIDPERKWSESELALITAVVDQVAQFAEILRLLDETQERASREQLISQISTKMRRAPDMETLLKVAVTELSRVLSPARTFVHMDFKGVTEPAKTKLVESSAPDKSQQHSEEAVTI